MHLTARIRIRMLGGGIHLTGVRRLGRAMHVTGSIRVRGLGGDSGVGGVPVHGRGWEVARRRRGQAGILLHGVDGARDGIDCGGVLCAWHVVGHAPLLVGPSVGGVGWGLH